MFFKIDIKLTSLLPVPQTIYSKGTLLDLSKPIVMGILNATPNSFYNKGKDSDMDSLLRNADKMLNDGATILDIGGASTKPGSHLMNPNEELINVLPVVEAIHKRFPDTWLSIDTYNAVVAKDAVEAGVKIVNDISSGKFDAKMLETVAALKVPYIAMHIQGEPLNMQINPLYTNIVEEIIDYLRLTCQTATDAGIKDIIIDPGFGFGKTVTHNFNLLNSLKAFRIIGKPILVGLSRKSMICKPLKMNPENALNGTTILNTIAVLQGAVILRVHDVKEAVEVVKLAEYISL